MLVPDQNRYQPALHFPVVMFRKAAVLKAGNYMEFPYNEDYYLWVRMLVRGHRFYNIQDSLLLFRSSEKTFKRRGGWKHAWQDILLQKEFRKLGLVTTIPGNYRPKWSSYNFV